MSVLVGPTGRTPNGLIALVPPLPSLGSSASFQTTLGWMCLGKVPMNGLPAKTISLDESAGVDNRPQRKMPPHVPEQPHPAVQTHLRMDLIKPLPVHRLLSCQSQSHPQKHQLASCPCPRPSISSPASCTQTPKPQRGLARTSCCNRSSAPHSLTKRCALRSLSRHIRLQQIQHRPSQYLHMFQTQAPSSPPPFLICFRSTRSGRWPNQTFLSGTPWKLLLPLRPTHRTRVQLHSTRPRPMSLLWAIFPCRLGRMIRHASLHHKRHLRQCLPLKATIFHRTDLLFQ